MANSFTYFLAQDAYPTQRDLQSLPLRAPMVRSEPVAGPDGIGGYLVGESSGGVPRYEPAAQTWVPRDAQKKQWAGVYRDALPGPDDLRRDPVDMVDGVPAVMADGQRWTLPRLLYVDGTVALPQLIIPGINGGIARKVMPRYEALCARGVVLWEMLMYSARLRDAKPSRTLTEDEQVILLWDCLALNYRVGPAEIGLLGLTSDRLLGLHLSLLMGVDMLAKLQEASMPGKSRGPAESETSGGPGAPAE